MLNFLKKQPISFYLIIIGCLLVLIPTFYMIPNYIKTPDFVGGYLLSVIFVFAFIVIRVGALFIKNKRIANYIALLVFVMLCFAFALYLQGSILSTIDHIFNIVMWGDPTQFPSIVIFGILFLLGVLSNLVSFWLE